MVKNRPTSRNTHVKKRRSYKLPEKEKTSFLINNLNGTGLSVATMKARRHWSTAFKTVNKNPFNLEFYTLLYYQSDKRVGQ